MDKGETHFRTQQYQLAIAAYDRAIQLAPEGISGYLKRSIAYYGLKECQKMVADLDRALVEPR